MCMSHVVRITLLQTRDVRINTNIPDAIADFGTNHLFLGFLGMLLSRPSEVLRKGSVSVSESIVNCLIFFGREGD